MAPAASPPTAGAGAPRVSTAMLTNSGASVFPVASWVARSGRLLPPSSAVPGATAGGGSHLVPTGRAGAPAVAFVGGDCDAYNRRMARRSHVEAVEAAVGGRGGGAMSAAAAAGGVAAPVGTAALATASTAAAAGAGGAKDAAAGAPLRPQVGYFGANTSTYGRRWRVLAEVGSNTGVSSRGFVRVAANSAEYDRRMLVRNESP